MKLGRRKLVSIFERETGIPRKDILAYGIYDSYGNKEIIKLGARSIVALNGEISITAPMYIGEEILYETKKIKEVSK